MSRRGSLRRLVAVATVTVAALGALVACAPERDPSWTPAAWTPAVVTVVGRPAPLDPATLPGLVGERIRNDTFGVQARWMRPSGDTALGAVAESLVRGALAGRTAETGLAYTPAVFPRGAGMADRGCVPGSTDRPAAEILADPVLGPAAGTGTAVVCDIVAAAGTWLGERIRTVRGVAGDVVSDAGSTLYADSASGQVVTATELWQPGAPAALWPSIVDAVRRSHGSLSLVAPQPPDEAALALLAAGLARTVPGADGSLLVTLPAGFTSPELDRLGVPPASGPTTLAVPPAVSASLVTPAGASLVAAAVTPFAAPAAVTAGAESVPCDLVPCVAVTYDDGPGEGTPAILDEVAARHAAVTFFAMGQKAAGSAAVMQRALAEGNLVENHTWNHPRLPTLTRAQVATQIGDTTTAIGLAAGRAPTVFRPPYGDYDAEVLSAAGMAAILWDVDTLDWQGPSDEELVRRAVDGPRPGSVVLQHDIQAVTVRTAGAVYDGLLDRGFTLVNIAQLWGGDLPSRGVWRTAY